LKAQALSIMWQPPLEHYMDALAEKLLDHVRARKVTRLFIDSIDGLRDGGIRTDRMNRYMIALTNELRSLGVTTLVAEEKPFSQEEAVPASAFSAAAENILCLKHVEHDSRLSRVIFLIKVREGSHDSHTREFKIVAKRGIVLGEPLKGSAASPAGSSRARAPAAKPHNAKSRNHDPRLAAKKSPKKLLPPVPRKAPRRP
jgi:circadian clock protein KaiC